MIIKLEDSKNNTEYVNVNHIVRFHSFNNHTRINFSDGEADEYIITIYELAKLINRQKGLDLL